MKRLSAIALIPLMLTVSISTVASAGQPSKTYRNCTELRKTFPHGVAKSARTAGTTGAKVNAEVYAENVKSDRDKDGVACER